MVRFSFSLSTAQKEWLEEQAEIRDTSEAQVVRDLVDDERIESRYDSQSDAQSRDESQSESKSDAVPEVDRLRDRVAGLEARVRELERNRETSAPGLSGDSRPREDAVSTHTTGDVSAGSDGTDASEEPHTTPETEERTEVVGGTDATVEELVEELHLPGSGARLKRRRRTIVRLYEHLRDARSATKADFLELVDPEEVSYETADSFWGNCAQGAMKELPGVDSPGPGEHTWRYFSPDVEE